MLWGNFLRECVVCNPPKVVCNQAEGHTPAVMPYTLALICIPPRVYARGCRRLIHTERPHPSRPATPCLAAARSRSGSDSRLGCHSLPSRASLPTGEGYASRRGGCFVLMSVVTLTRYGATSSPCSAGTFPHRGRQRFAHDPYFHRPLRSFGRCRSLEDATRATAPKRR